MSFLEPLQLLAGPIILLVMSLFYLTATIFHYILSLRFPSTLWEFRHAWFSRLWSYLGPVANAGSAHLVAPLLSCASGRVLDLGPGSGLTLQFLNPEAVRSSLAVEPAVDLHPELKKNAEKAGLKNFEIRTGGAEGLGDLEEGSFDTVLCCRVLCGVPEPEKVAKLVYRALRPGGTVLVYEHVRNERSALIRFYQRLLSTIWPHLMGGCQVMRPTATYLKNAGKWEIVELGPPKGESWYDPIPYTMGRLVKAGGKKGE